MPISENVEIRHGVFTIAQSPSEPVPLELHPRLFKLSNVISWGLWALYILFQFTLLLSAQVGTPYFLWRLWIVLLAEVCLSTQEVVLAISTILALFGAKEFRARPCYRLIGSAAPSVDVFVPCCGEPTDVVVDTIAAVIAQDYPSHRFRVFILDDGHVEILREAVEALSIKSAEKNGPHVRYLSRKLEAGSKSYFKAGNLQFGIEESGRLGGSEYVASLDADMIPESDWLRKMVPHLILGEKLALACPPQRYYNVPDGDPLGQQAEFDIWFTIFEPLNDRLDAAMCTGSGFVVKRSALVDIGGWPLVDAGEDFMCSALLSNAGWKVAFVRQDVQYGLAPNSLRAHVKQRMRWVDSGIEVHKQFGFYLSASKIASQMTWTQRGVGILQASREYAPVVYVLALILLPAALFPTQSDEFAKMASGHDLVWLRRVFLAAFLTHKMNDYIVYGHVGLRGLACFQSMDIWFAPYAASRCILSLLPSTANSLTFESSGSITSPANERSRLHRQPLPQRLLSPDLVMYLCYIIYACVPLSLRLYRGNVEADPSGSGSASVFPFPGAMLKLLDAVAKAAVPLWYMLYPPTVPDREQLIEPDEHDGVRRPRKRTKAVQPGRGRDMAWPWTDVWEMCFVCWWCWQ